MFIFVRWGGGGGRAGRRSEERVGDNLIGHHLLALEPVPRQSLRLGSSEKGGPAPNKQSKCASCSVPGRGEAIAGRRCTACAVVASYTCS